MLRPFDMILFIEVDEKTQKSRILHWHVSIFIMNYLAADYLFAANL